MKFCLCIFLGVFFLSTELIAETVLYFSPEVDVSSVFVEKVRNERKSIKLISYRLSNLKVIQALEDAHRRGVSVEVIVDKVSITKNSPLKTLVEEGGSVLVWSPANKKPMNYNFCVLGSSSSWTSSHVFYLKEDLERFENAVFLEDKKVAAAYLIEFERIKGLGVVSFSKCFKEKGFSL
jgi:mitochondrial cardiolipin hydrolase